MAHCRKERFRRLGGKFIQETGWTGRSGGSGRWKADQIETTYKLRMQALSWS